MRISIVSGFFLPVPPVSGGATEKSWYRLAREFTARGHQVTFLSRRWPGFPNEEIVEGIRHVRLSGFDHQRKLWRNLLLDFIWSWRIFFALPAADIVVVHAVTLPAWLGWLKPRAGRVVIMTGRMPKGQYRRYRRLARVLAPSSFVREKVIAENRGLASITHVTGYPIDCGRFRSSNVTEPTPAITIGFVGRLHEEKGLRLFAEAVEILGKNADLPPWRLLICGPSEIARGGSGPEFRDQIFQRIHSTLPLDRVDLIEPQFNEEALAAIYRRIGIFCYPSLAEQGETFGVAVAEAMAAGAVPVVSQLACFTELVHHEKNGLVFDHRPPDAPAMLAAALSRLLRNTGLRDSLAQTAKADVQRYDFSNYATTLLTDFEEMLNRPSGNQG